MTESVDGVMERHSASDVQNNTLHVMDTETRIATLRIGQRFPDDGTPSTKYALGDHVGGINTVVGDEGALVNREEYTPYGDTSFGSFARKRYRFTGRERDAESGLYYHWGRYDAPYLATWVSADPAGVIDGCRLYRYAADNPLTFVDRSGTQSTEAEVRLRQSAYDHESSLGGFVAARDKRDQAQIKVDKAEFKRDNLNPGDPEFNDRITGKFRQEQFEAKP